MTAPVLACILDNETVPQFDLVCDSIQSIIVHANAEGIRYIKFTFFMGCIIIHLQR